jgi:putative Holliday junction resolvase
MRCLGLDLGTKTLGLAMSDKTNFIASPYRVLRWDGEDYELLFKDLDKIITDNNITDLVLGLPKNMNGTIGFQAEYCLKFKEMLEAEVKLPVIMIDERMTSRMAHNTMLKADMSRNKRKQNVDKLAATIILQTYLDSMPKY